MVTASAMAKTARIYVAGHRGLVGSALVRNLQHRGYANLVTRSHVELDLINSAAVREFFERERPQYVFLAAARVGGILANQLYPAEFIYDNLAIQNNIICESRRVGVKRLLFLGSSCVYPRDCPQPITEESLLSGPLESTNRAYAIAKIAGIEMCRSFNQQYGTHYLAVMPSNLYGPGDNYDLQTAHALAALIRKLHEARCRGDAHATAWGTGAPRREWLFSDDLADACVFLMSLPDDGFIPLTRPGAGAADMPLINIGTGVDFTIRELLDLVKRIVGYRGAIVWDGSKPDGTPQKLLEGSRIRALGWSPKHGLEAGIHKTYRDFQSRYCNQEILQGGDY
jgi:GDP-L-fucose synthase